MPIYEFRCPRCRGEFAALLPMGSGSPSCPSCGAESTERLVSRIAARVAPDGAGCACGGACSCSAN